MADRSLSPEVPKSFSVLYPNRKQRRCNTSFEQSGFKTPQKDQDEDLVAFDSPFSSTIGFHPKSPSFNDEDFKHILKSPLQSTEKPNTDRQMRHSELFNFEEIPVVENSEQVKFEVQESLSFPEKITHEKWQVRKSAYQEISECLTTKEPIQETDPYEYFEPWLRNLAFDPNLASQLEGLHTVLCYVKNAPFLKHSTLKLGEELIQKSALNKHKIAVIIDSILVCMLQRGSETVLLNALLKHFSAKNPKEACFAMNCVKEALPCFPDSVCQSLFNAINSALTHNISEVRNASISLAAEFYCYLSDEQTRFISEFKGLKEVQKKELAQALKTKVEAKWTLFEEKEDEEVLLLWENQTATQSLQNLVPEGFLEVPYMSDMKAKREVIAKFIKEIEKPGLVLQDEECNNVVVTLLNMLENSTFLIFSEALKALEILVPRVPKAFMFKAKHFANSLCEKYKEKKKSVNCSVNNVLSSLRSNCVLPPEVLFDTVSDIPQSHKVPLVRQLVLKWIELELELSPCENFDLLSGEPQAPWHSQCIEKLTQILSKKLWSIWQKDTSAEVRNASASLLRKLRKLVDHGATAHNLDKIISKLPKPRTSELNNKRQHKYSESDLLWDKTEHSFAQESTKENKNYAQSRSPSPFPSIHESTIDQSPRKSSVSLVSSASPNKDLKDIQMLICEGDVYIKQEGLNRLLKYVENFLASKSKIPKVGSWRRGMGRRSQESLEATINNETLEDLVRSILEECLKSKHSNLADLAIEALTSLRIIIQEQGIKSSFEVLVEFLPKVTDAKLDNYYQLLSDWVANWTTSQVTSILFQVHHTHKDPDIFLYILQWLQKELTAPTQVQSVSVLVPPLVQALCSKAPFDSSHPPFAQIFIDFLQSLDEALSLSDFLKSNLNSDLAKAYEDYTAATYKFASPETNPTEVSFDSSSKRLKAQELDLENPIFESSKKKLNFEELKESWGLWKEKYLLEEQEHTKTKNLLQEANKEYLNQVAINEKLLKEIEDQRNLIQQLQKNLQKKHSPTKTFIQKPATSFEELMSQSSWSDKPAIDLFSPPQSSILPQNNRTQGILDFQKLLLSTKDPFKEVRDPLLQAYSTSDKTQLLQDIKTALENQDILQAASNSTLKALLEAVLKFCVLEKLQSEGSDFLIETYASASDLSLTHRLQSIVSKLLETREPTVVLSILIGLILETLPSSFKTLEEEQRVHLRLVLKCLNKMVSVVYESNLSVRVFDILNEMNKLFEKHPPENLTSESPSVHDYEHMFKVIRNTADVLMSLQPEKVKSFVEFSLKHSNSNLFLKYLSGTLQKKYKLTI